MKKVNILIIGPVSSPGSLVGSYARAFDSNKNVETKIFDTSKEALNGREMVYSLFSRLIRKIVYYQSNFILRRKLIQRIKQHYYYPIDLIFDFKSFWLTPDDIQNIKIQTNIPFFHFNADSPFDRHKANYHLNLIKSIPNYDCYFTWNKGLISELYAHGANNIAYLPFAWDPEIHPFSVLKGTGGDSYDSEIAFIGNWTAEREKWLEKLADFDLNIWGEPACLWSKMKSGSKLFDKWQPFSVRETSFVNVVRSSKINLNFLREQNKGSHNMRSFEVPGCGGFLLTERSKEQSEFFEEDKEIACFSDEDELRDKIEYYLPRNELRLKMIQAAHEKVEKGHTYRDRAKQIIKVYQEGSVKSFMKK